MGDRADEALGQEWIKALTEGFLEDTALSDKWSEALAGSFRYDPPRLPREIVEPIARASELEMWIKTFSDEIDRLFLEGSPEIPPRARIRYVLVLRAICQFFSVAGFSKLAQAEVIELALALKDLDHGTVRPCLRPIQAQNRPLDRGDIWLARVYVVIAIDHLTSLGLSTRRSACKYVAKNYDCLQFALAPKSVNFATTVEGWCRSFQSGAVKDDRADGIFNDRERIVESYLEYLPSKGVRAEPFAVFEQLMRVAIGFTARASDSEAIERYLQDKRVVRNKPTSNYAVS